MTDTRVFIYICKQRQRGLSVENDTVRFILICVSAVEAPDGEET